jgi:hypothetical protein
MIAEIQRREEAPRLVVRACLVGASEEPVWVTVHRGTDEQERAEAIERIRTWRCRPALIVEVLPR